MSRIEPDMAYKYVEEFGADAFIYDHKKQPAEGHYFHRSTILVDIDRKLALYCGRPSSRDEYDRGYYDALMDLRARFHPTEGENGQ